MQHKDWDQVGFSHWQGASEPCHAQCIVDLVTLLPFVPMTTMANSIGLHQKQGGLTWIWHGISRW